MEWLLANQSKAYWIAFVGVFMAAAIAESIRPARVIARVERRWLRHGALFAAGASVARLVLRLSPVGVALLRADSEYGLLNRLPFWPACVLTIVTLDFVHYATHWTYHHVGWFWRMHSVHHSDADYDVSTAVRFHPLEIVAGSWSTLVAVALLAPPPSAVLCSEFLTIVMNLAVHANVDYPVWPENSIYLKQREIIPGVVDNEAPDVKVPGPVPLSTDLPCGLDEPAPVERN